MHAPCIHQAMGLLSHEAISHLSGPPPDARWCVDAAGECWGELSAGADRTSDAKWCPPQWCLLVYNPRCISTNNHIVIIYIILFYIYITYPGIQNHYYHNGGSLTTMFKPKPRMVVHLGVSARFGPSNHRDMIVVGHSFFSRFYDKGLYPLVN